MTLCFETIGFKEFKKFPVGKLNFAVASRCRLFEWFDLYKIVVKLSAATARHRRVLTSPPPEKSVTIGRQSAMTKRGQHRIAIN